MSAPDLSQKICIVAGASRGVGRGLARALGEAGATVIVTARSSETGARTEMRPESIEDTARLVDADPNLTLLMEPELSVVVFRRTGWTMSDYQRWCDRLLAEGTAFILPTMLHGEPCLRFCFVNPRTTIEDVRKILGSLAGK